MQLYGALAVTWVIMLYIQFETPINSFFHLPTDDPNAILKDPYRMQRVWEKQQREAEMRKRALADNDRLGGAMSYNIVNKPGDDKSATL